MTRITLKLVLTLALFAAIASASNAQTTSVNAGVNIGNPSQATFYFSQNLVGGTQIVIQCSFNRGFYTSNFDVYGQQQTTEFTIPGCVSTSSKNAQGQLVLTYTVIGTPVTFEAGGQTISELVRL